MSTINDIEKLKSELLSEEDDVAFNASQKLSEIKSQEIIDFLLPLLNSDNPKTRHIVALTLHDIGSNQAIDPLFDAIFKPENKNYTGTLIYALETLDCSEKLKELFEILFLQGYEAKVMAASILNEQTFNFTRQDIIEIQSRWQYILNHPAEFPELDEEDKSDIQIIMEKFE